MATLNDIFATAAIGVWCMLATGCGEAFTTRHERLERAVSAVSLATEEGRMAVAEHGTNIVRMALAMPREERAKALENLAELFMNIDFDERSYPSRLESMAAYSRLVAIVTEGLRKPYGIEDEVWRFRLAAVDRINVEIDRCEREPRGGPYGDVSKIGAGPFMTQRQYLSFLMSRRFDLVYDGFEMRTGWFPLHFNALSPSKRKEWQLRLEKVAHRRVVVWDPRNPFAKMPRYEEEDTREWLPQKSPDEPRRYVEHLGGGRTAIGFETRWGMETRKRREEQRRLREAGKNAE